MWRRSGPRRRPPPRPMPSGGCGNGRCNGLTYQIQTVRIEDGAVVQDASARATPVRATVTIFRGREVVRTFNFTPRDNRNLALFGE